MCIFVNIFVLLVFLEANKHSINKVSTDLTGKYNLFSLLLEDTACYAGLLLAPAEGFGLQPRDFLALRAKKGLIILFWPILGYIWCPVVTLVTLSSNLSNFKKNPKYTKKIQKNTKQILKNPENP